ncbi:hypothetical protein GP486_000742 [Trichoglossum hirsutum]|uniref:Uncharacterized protein n=1 Tax=Trichoglossum hirsutum TaxID=265104 RepID=A0A9P8LIG9_9PEZI|nr:hypothetical protein GP486_000742 [Trichoglossum hirsutum]
MANIVTLGNLIVKIGKFADAYKDSKNQVERYRTALQRVENSRDIIVRLVSESESASAISVTIEGENFNVIDICSQNIEAVMKDAEQFFQLLEKAQSKGIREFLGSWIEYLRRSGLKIRRVIADPHINRLVETAKHAEISLHVALSTLTFARMHANTGNWQQAFIDLNKKIHDLQADVQCATEEVVWFKGREPSSSRIRFPRLLSDRRKRALKDKDRDGSLEESSLSTSRSASNIFSEDAHATSAIKIEEDIAILRNDGRLDILHGPSSREEPSTTEPELATMQKGEDGRTELLIESDDGHINDESYVSDLRDQSLTFIHEPSVELKPDGMVFIDGTVKIADCTSSETGVLRFCTRTLIVGDDNHTSAMLKEPCGTDPNGCGHISIYSRPHPLFEKQSPYSFQVTLQHGPISSADATTNESGEPESLVLNYSDSCNDPELHTLIYSHEGARIRYAARTKLSIAPILDANLNDGEADEGERDGTGADADIPTEGNEIAHGIRSFTRVPCIFCGVDALQPVQDAGGVVGAVIYSNRSFGYTCQRCNKRSWVSGGEFGLSFPGASWSWWD